MPVNLYMYTHVFVREYSIRSHGALRVRAYMRPRVHVQLCTTFSTDVHCMVNLFTICKQIIRVVPGPSVGRKQTEIYENCLSHWFPVISAGRPTFQQGRKSELRFGKSELHSTRACVQDLVRLTKKRSSSSGNLTVGAAKSLCSGIFSMPS